MKFRHHRDQRGRINVMNWQDTVTHAVISQNTQSDRYIKQIYLAYFSGSLGAVTQQTPGKRTAGSVSESAPLMAPTSQNQQRRFQTYCGIQPYLFVDERLKHDHGRIAITEIRREHLTGNADGQACRQFCSASPETMTFRMATYRGNMPNFLPSSEYRG